MSLRNDFAENIVDVLKDMQDPKPGLVTREPFEPEKLAITQFPALLVNSGNETRIDYAVNKRQGIISYNIRAFLRGKDLDRIRNDMIERIEETLSADTYRGSLKRDVNTQITSIQVIDRLSPLAEVAVTVEVKYLYNKGEL
tara:strand:- start:17 stop:439 length:423 start_codon:yes stop_codon:yes gene_type:complete